MSNTPVHSFASCVKIVHSAFHCPHPFMVRPTNVRTNWPEAKRDHVCNWPSKSLAFFKGQCHVESIWHATDSRATGCCWFERIFWFFSPQETEQLLICGQRFFSIFGGQKLTRSFDIFFACCFLPRFYSHDKTNHRTKPFFGAEFAWMAEKERDKNLVRW